MNGRHQHIRHPLHAALRIRALDYGEFLRFHDLEDSDESLAFCLRDGGLPFLRNPRLGEETSFEYLRGVFDAIVLNDIVQRHGVRNPAILGRIVEFRADSIGSQLSARNVSNDLKAKGIENAVYLKLAGEGWDIRSGRVGAAEVDFVCDRAGARIYVQAACLVPDAATRPREFGLLLGIHDAWPRYLVYLDPLRADYEGVRHLGLREFLSRPSPGSPASPAPQ